MSSIQDLYAERRYSHSDIHAHLPYLRALADKCDVVAEFGVRTGNSTVAFLASKCNRVVSFDIEAPQFQPPEDAAGKWEFHLADTSALSESDFPKCDLLFIDTKHTAAQVCAELRHAAAVAKYLVFHDTHLFGCCEEGRPGEQVRGPGILAPILIFLTAHPEWRVRYHSLACCGLTVLERLDVAGFKIGDGL